MKKSELAKTYLGTLASKVEQERRKEENKRKRNMTDRMPDKPQAKRASEAPAPPVSAQR